MKRDIIEFAKKEFFVTNAPPVQPAKPVPWSSTYSMLSKDVHNKANSHMLVNYCPMLKPPQEIEETATGEIFDVARTQFVPHMAKQS